MFNVAVDNTLSREDALHNIKNGYLAVAATFVTTLIGYCVGLYLMNTFGIMFSGFMGMILFMVVGIGLIFAIQKFQHSTTGLVLLLLFGALEGIMITPLIAFSAPSAVLGALAGTIVLTAGSSYVAIKGNVDSSSWGKYLFVALLAIIVCMVINIFMGSSFLSLIISSASVLVFTGLMVYDTQEAMKNPRASYVSVALSFYLNIINIFIHLLNILNIVDND